MARLRDDATDVLASLNRLIEQAREHVEQLTRYRDKIVELEAQLRVTNLYRLGGLTASTRLILGLLMKREIVYKSTMYSALYEHRAANDQPDIKVIDQFLWKLRSALAVWDIVLHANRGGVGEDPGYFLTPQAKEKIIRVTAAAS